MKPFVMIAAAVAVLVAPLAAIAGTKTYVFAVTHSRYGDIGSYERTVDDGTDQTKSHSLLKIVVHFMGMVVHREQVNQFETWRGGKLQSFASTAETNGHLVTVSGEAKAGQFMITCPAGTTAAPADVTPADPWAFSKASHGEVVSIHDGRVEPVDVAGGEPTTVMIGGAPITARHYHASTPGKPNRWEVWLDRDGAPIKFRSVEPSGSVDFTLVSGPAPGDGAAVATR